MKRLRNTKNLARGQTKKMRNMRVRLIQIVVCTLGMVTKCLGNKVKELEIRDHPDLNMI